MVLFIAKQIRSKTKFNESVPNNKKLDKLKADKIEVLYQVGVSTC